MPETTEGRVAVYIDFDNIVISRYDQLHGSGRFHKDKARRFTETAAKADSEVATRLAHATVNIGAVLDFASSFGTIVLSRAYADWSLPVNASYQKQLIERAIDLTQMFPTVASMKNGADIRLAVDVVEDLFRLPDLTHVVIVAGDSDYIALAQRCKRLGRYVVGIGVAGGTSKALAAACDEFADYDAMPGLGAAEPDLTAATVAEAERPSEPAPTDEHGGDQATTDATEVPASKTRSRRASSKAQPIRTAEPDDPQKLATGLLVRALQLGQAKMDDEWLNSSWVKNQMLRMDPSFSERSVGFSKFNDFVTSRGEVVEVKKEGVTRLIRLRPERANS